MVRYEPTFFLAAASFSSFSACSFSSTSAIMGALKTQTISGDAAKDAGPVRLLQVYGSVIVEVLSLELLHV